MGRGGRERTNLSYPYELIEFAPSERLAMRTTQGPFPMGTTYTWSATNDGKTRMTSRNREPTGFSKLIARAMRQSKPQGPRQTAIDPRDNLKAASRWTRLAVWELLNSTGCAGSRSHCPT